jgi:hypothetical protein
VRNRWYTGNLIPIFGTILFVVAGFALVLHNKSGHKRHPARYGQVDIPGSQSVTLPKGRVDLILESDVDEGFGFKAPSESQLTVSVVPAAGGATAPKITRDVGGDYELIPGATQRVSGVPNTYRRLWRIQVPQAGVYVVTTGPVTVRNPHRWDLDLGTSPTYSDAGVWEHVGIVWLIFLALWFTVWFVTRRMDRRSESDPAPATSSSFDGNEA